MKGSEFLEIQKEKEARRAGLRKKHKEAWPSPVMEEIFFGRLDKQFVEGKRLIMDAKTGIQWDVVSDKYQIVHHEDVLASLLESTPKEFGEPEVHLTFWKDGGRFRATATFPDLGDMEVRKGDPVRPKVIFKNSYDRSSYVRMEFGAVQLVCSNGLVAYQTEEEISSRHLGEVNIVSLSKHIKEKIEKFSEQLGIWQSWAELPLQDDLVVSAKSMPFTEKEQEKLLVLPLLSNKGRTLRELGKKATVWDLNSAATQFAKHEIKGVQRSFDLEGQIAKATTLLAKELD